MDISKPRLLKSWGQVMISAAFSTGSVINATLFSSARRVYRVSEEGELPTVLEHKNKAVIPDRAVIALGTIAALLAAVGTLTTLVGAQAWHFYLRKMVKLFLLPMIYGQEKKNIMVLIFQAIIDL